VKSNVPVAEAIIEEGVLPERVQEALGDLVGAAKEGLLALSVEVGLGVLHELLELEVDEVVGPKGRWIRTGPRSVTAMRMARSRSAAGGLQSSARGCARPMGSAR
jgi:hypothetical protein